MNKQERLAKAIELNKLFVANNFASQVAVKDLVRSDELTEAEIRTLMVLYPGYVIGEPYEVGDIFKHGDNLYEVIQAHISQIDWEPSITASLYKKKIPESVTPEFIQPTGEHDAYQIGDRVLFEGLVYESVINANTWSPAAYPAGWQLV